MRRLAALALSITAVACVPEGRRSTLLNGADGGVPPVDARTDPGVPDTGVEPTDSGNTDPSPDAGGTTSPDASAPDAATRPDAGRPDASAPDAGPLACMEEPNRIASFRANVYYGTAQPTYVPLTAGQILAIGSFDGCSGALVTDRWVLTAQHCQLNRNNAEFCIGAQPANPNICFTASQVVNHPNGDLTLVQLSQSAASRAPTVEPIALFSDILDQTWIGETAEASGYGQQENGGYGEREFTAEPIVRIQGDLITIDGMGQRGVCFGDSGGPLMVIAADNTVRVAGALSFGDESCTGQDNYTRVDTYRTWIEGYVGPIQPPGPRPCGTVTVTGACDATQTVASWCNNGTLQEDTCTSGQVCGWSSNDQGWRCVAPNVDPCQGAPALGECTNGTLTWCTQGTRHVRNCQACGEYCAPASDTGYTCADTACGDLDFLGRCDGNTALWCNRQNVPETRDCAAAGQTCGYVDAQTGYFCR